MNGICQIYDFFCPIGNQIFTHLGSGFFIFGSHKIKLLFLFRNFSHIYGNHRLIRKPRDFFTVCKRHRNRNNPVYVPSKCHFLNFFYILIRKNHDIISFFSQKLLQLTNNPSVKRTFICRASGKCRRIDQNADNFRAFISKRI